MIMYHPVLVVEDDPVIAEALRLGLTEAGFRPVVAGSITEALSLAATIVFDLIVMDLGLPDGDGLYLCRRFRADDKERPIIILTARDTDLDVIIGLDAGADDYVTKPVSIAVVAARVRAHLRGRLDNSRGVLTVGDLCLTAVSRTVTKADQLIELRPREFDLLQRLMRRAGLVVLRKTLLAELWGDEWSKSSSKSLDVHIVTLRRKLADEAEHPTWITTIRGVGYRFANA